VQSTLTTIEVEAPEPSFTGGDSITQYVFVRDDGPLTSYLTQETSTTNTFTFEGLTAGTQYRFKVAVINTIG
jgi:hypothetical protein